MGFSMLRYLLVFLTIFCFYSCKKNKSGLPQLETAMATEITMSSALSGGKILDNGGYNILYAGICWSKTEKVPTVSDDTTKTFTSSTSFKSLLKNLTPSSTYYVRAYATTSNGTGYGNVISFTIGNAAPIASDVVVSGSANSNEVLTASYTYSDYEGDVETGTTIQWYLANSSNGTAELPITGATSKTFKVGEIHKGKFVRFSIIPKATTGNMQGLEVKSAFVGPVGDSITVTFMYNGQEVTYGIITSPRTGRKWMDRNLGALRAAETYFDNLAAGDLFQWGRPADGHQLILRTSGSTIPVNGVTSISSTTDKPGTSAFITAPIEINDWRTPQNSNLWQGVNGVNNPCPAGWKIPSKSEWDAENISASDYALLKLTTTGFRFRDGELVDTETLQYWSSTTAPPEDGSIYKFGTAWKLGFRPPPASQRSRFTGRVEALACRCIKN